MADRVNRSTNTLLYLYGITEAPESLPATLRGVDGTSAVEALDCSGFTCWISRVSAPEFGDNLSRNMENLEWLANASVRHQRVVGAIHELQPILPARFGTVFRHYESLAEDVAGRKAALKTGFRRIAGADEWGVRVFAAARPVMTAGSSRTGKEYLQRKSALLQAKPSRTLEPEVKQMAGALLKIATDSAEAGKVSSGQPGLRWQRSLLLPRARRAQFDSLLARFADKWQERFRLECTGPWPPYSFVADEAPAPRRRQAQKRRMPKAPARGVAR